MNGSDANCPDFYDADQQAQYAKGYKAAFDELRKELRRQSH